MTQVSLKMKTNEVPQPRKTTTRTDKQS